MRLFAACAFGLEAVVKRELAQLGYEATIEQPGRVAFDGDELAICRANLWLRTADRVSIAIAQFPSPDFDALFETVKALDWSQYLTVDAEFPVTGRSRKSQLTSVPAVQRTVKRAAVDGMKRVFDTETLPETGPKYGLDISLLDDIATLTLDTTGPSLHKRGYRKLVGEAPLKETLAAAMISLSVWNPDRPLIDPFCGSGTIPIEAALAGLNIAPGINREFSCQHWPLIAESLWHESKEEANQLQRRDLQLQIIGTDQDENVLDLARYHAVQAGVESQIHFQQQAFSELRSQREYGCVITNPPYGERLDERSLQTLYESFPGVLQRLPTWSHFILTSVPFEKIVRLSATRRRKLFNGRIECYYYQYLGPRPPRKSVGPATKSDETSTKEPAVAKHANSDVIEQAYSETLIAPPVHPDSNTAVVTAAPFDLDPSSVAHSISDATSEFATPPEFVQPPEFGNPSGLASDELKPTQPKPVPRQLPESDAQQSTYSAQEPKVKSEAEVKSRSNELKPVFAGSNEQDNHQAELFATRLKKRARHFRRWPKRGITCYRLYERDIPEIPFVVDIYDDELHMTEYERPHDREFGRHAAWIELMKKAASTALEIPISKVHLKSRLRQRGSLQYEKVEAARQFKQVIESGLTFLVNLTDYIDTGLFLDHRQTRAMVRAEARGKRFLNLFAYTGAFSVYAAAGGAKSTVSVDLSRNYLDWAHRNMKSNSFEGDNHQFAHQDCLEYLDDAAARGEKFDLAVVDPPTFSNSKQTDTDWEVQKQHVELLLKVHQVMTEDSVVYFSTNFRRFKLDEDALQPYFRILEISKQTISEEFRNRRIHRCWKLFVLKQP